MTCETYLKSRMLTLCFLSDSPFIFLRINLLLFLLEMSKCVFLLLKCHIYVLRIKEWQTKFSTVAVIL